MNETRDSSHRLLKFGVFELDLRSGELRKSGARVSLQQQPLQLLSALLERPAELVTRDELRKRLWPDDTFVDFDHGVSAAVKRLRQALGDSADSPRFVETVPRRGYRFIAPVNRHRRLHRTRGTCRRTRSWQVGVDHRCRHDGRRACAGDRRLAEAGSASRGRCADRRRSRPCAATDHWIAS